METVTIEKNQVMIALTAADIAKAFWDMHSELQAQFFDQLGAVIEEDHKTNPSAYSYGERQWCQLKYELRQPGMERANNMHMALSAFAYDFVDRKPEGCRT